MILHGTYVIDNEFLGTEIVFIKHPGGLLSSWNRLRPVSCGTGLTGGRVAP
jgi:hypothetical protein